MCNQSIDKISADTYIHQKTNKKYIPAYSSNLAEPAIVLEKGGRWYIKKNGSPQR